MGNVGRQLGFHILADDGQGLFVVAGLKHPAGHFDSLFRLAVLPEQLGCLAQDGKDVAVRALQLHPGAVCLVVDGFSLLKRWAAHRRPVLFSMVDFFQQTCHHQHSGVPAPVAAGGESEVPLGVVDDI